MLVKKNHSYFFRRVLPTRLKFTTKVNSPKNTDFSKDYNKNFLKRRAICLDWLTSGICSRKYCYKNHEEKDKGRIKLNLSGLTVCLDFFNKANCNYGCTCKFLHVDETGKLTETAFEKPKVCKDWAKMGICAVIKTCEFDHNPKFRWILDELRARLSITEGKDVGAICFQFYFTNNCIFGNNCGYNHVEYFTQKIVRSKQEIGAKQRYMMFVMDNKKQLLFISALTLSVVSICIGFRKNIVHYYKDLVSE